MPSINLYMITYRLNIDLKHYPIRQKWKAFNSEHYETIKVEVDKLLKAELIRRVDYLTWLSNVVMVKKANRQWWVCVDFTDLNKAYPKDCFPLPKINQLVDAMMGDQLLSFMDAYSGYNQIMIYSFYQEYTSFITNLGLYCYILTLRTQEPCIKSWWTRCSYNR